MTPLNIYLFLVRLVSIAIASIVWNDRAIMLIHVVALAAKVFGLGGWNGWRCTGNQKTSTSFRPLLWSSPASLGAKDAALGQK